MNSVSGLLQLLQLWRSGSPCQGVWAAPPAKEMPLLPEHHAHDGSVSTQAAGPLRPRPSGPTCVYLGFQPRAQALPQSPRGGGALWLVSPGGLLLFPRGAPHTPRLPNAEEEEIMNIVHRGDSIHTLLLTHSIKVTWRPPNLPHLWRKWEVFTSSLWFCCFTNQRSYGNDQRDSDMCECVRLTRSHQVQLWQPSLEWWLQDISDSCFKFCSSRMEQYSVRPALMTVFFSSFSPRSPLNHGESFFL